MNGSSSVAAMLLKSSGLYSEEALGRIAAGREANPGMGLAEAAVKFGGTKEKDFLAGIGKVLGLKTVDLERQNPSPEALQKLSVHTRSSSPTILLKPSTKPFRTSTTPFPDTMTS